VTIFFTPVGKITMPDKLWESNRTSNDFSFWCQSGKWEVMLYYIYDV